MSSATGSNEAHRRQEGLLRSTEDPAYDGRELIEGLTAGRDVGGEGSRCRPNRSLTGTLELVDVGGVVEHRGRSSRLCQSIEHVKCCGRSRMRTSSVDYL